MRYRAHEARLTRKTAKQVEERRRAISEAFHSFHQPLTSLHCGLELTLLKQRSEGEYRQRVQEALVHAGAIFRLNRALRELVEATDPGEHFGRLALRPVVLQVVQEVSVVAEAALVAVSTGEIPASEVTADRLKLSRMLGQVLTFVITEMTPGSSLKITVGTKAEVATIRVKVEGKKREQRDEDGLEQKLRAIALDAARDYLQAIGGDFHEDSGSIVIKLPLVS